MEKYNYFKAEFEKFLKNYIEKTIHKEFLYGFEWSLFSGGKRLRPIIMWMLAKEMGIETAKIRNGMIGIELIHTFSLIQDDLPIFDDDDYRRGKLTLHKKYNEYYALLVSDLMLAKGIHLLFSYHSDKIERLIIDKIGEEGVLYGQLLDMREKPTDMETLEKIFSLKTLALFEISFFLPILIKGDEEFLKKIEAYVYEFGIAFQIYNDLKSRKKESKGILLMKDREKAKKMYEKKLIYSKQMFNLFKNDETLSVFNEIYTILEDV